MTKFLFPVLALTALCVNAQTSIQLKNKDSGSSIKPNAILIQATQALDNTKVTFDVKNTGNTTNEYNARRYDIILNSTATETAAAYFCFAGTCYGWQVTESPTSLTLTPGQSASEVGGNYQMLVADLDEAGTVGLSIVKYTFYNVANPNDSVQISIHYNGIDKQNISQVYGFTGFTSGSGLLDPTPTSTAFGTTFSGFSANGPLTNAASGGMFSFSGWPTGATNGNNNEAAMTGNIANGSYYQVTVTPKLGYYVTLNEATFDVGRSSDGPRHYSVRSSANSYAANVPGIVVSNTQLSADANSRFFWKYDSISGTQSGSKLALYEAAYKNFTDPITFRFHSWNAETSSGSFGIDNVNFDGFASVVITGFGEISHSLNAPFSIYPNPSNGRVTLSTGLTNCAVQVIDLSGKLVAETASEAGDVLVDLSHLSNGIYIVKVVSETTVSTEKLVISH